jgi:transmembrane sensor
MTQRVRVFSRIEVEASEWLVAMSDRSVTLEARRNFEAWLRASPEHERVYEAQKMAWSAVARMPHLLGETSPSDLRKHLPVHTRAQRSQARIFAFAAVLALLGTGWFFIQNPVSQTRARDVFETGVAQVEDIRLVDGTLVSLGASSRIEVELRKGERRVVLARGEAFFEVAHDASRPFLVSAGDTLIRVVGTKFDVRYGTETVRVGVLEGRVEVQETRDGTGPYPTQASAPKRVLTSGTAAVARRNGEIATTDGVKIEDLGAWRQGRLVYVDTSLRDVVADINRYYNGKIELADQSAGDMQLTAAFRIDQIDRMLGVLQNSAPIEVTRAPDGRIILSERLPQP